MTNKEAWELYTKDLSAPQPFLDYVRHYVWCAALERRVHFYPMHHKPMFCNLYVILVGPPGVGKGVAMGAARAILCYHKNKQATPITMPGGATDYPLLFPEGPTKTTLEGLLTEMSRCLRTGIISGPDKKPRTYIHHTMSYMLEELSSLFSASRTDISKFLLNAYDCGNYDYKPKHGPPDLLRNICLNLLAGTTPDFLDEAHKFKIFGDGFSSRTIFIFGTQRRNWNFHQSSITQEQEAALAQLRTHVLALSKLSGEIRYGTDVADYLEHWMSTTLKFEYENANHKMRDYYARKNAHVLKLAASIHFEESTDLSLTLSSVQAAIAELAIIEAQMSTGINRSGRNELSPAVARIRDMLAVSAMPRTILYSHLMNELTLDEFDECINALKLSSNLQEMTLQGQVIYKQLK